MAVSDPFASDTWQNCSSSQDHLSFSLSHYLPATMPARYERLPNPSSSHDPEGELEAAFELNDDDEDREQKGGRGRSQALTINTVTTKTTTIPTPLGSAARPGGYDFERQDYDFPPPGSPPPPTSRALPNDFGNSNGIVPSSPAVSQPPRPSFFRRAMGAFLPSQYTRVATSESSSRTVGGGTENDGVFANVAAKPQPGRMVQSDDGNFVVPEEVQKEMPPVRFAFCSTLRHQLNDPDRLTRRPKPTLFPRIGKLPSMLPRPWNRALT